MTPSIGRHLEVSFIVSKESEGLVAIAADGIYYGADLVTKKAVYKDILSESGVPSRVLVTPPISKKVFDTNMFNVLCQEVWFYYIGTKLKRISSEGKYRVGIGYIKSENKGFADLHGMYNGKAVYIETKQSTENHLKSQKELHFSGNLL